MSQITKQTWRDSFEWEVYAELPKERGRIDWRLADYLYEHDMNPHSAAFHYIEEKKLKNQG